MALIYHPNIRGLIANTGILPQFSSPSITLYSGTQPNPASIISSWSSYNSSSSDLLWHAQNGLTMSIINDVTVYASAFPALASPVRNGTASWAILWVSNLAYSAMGTSTIPSTYFIVLPVSNTTGNGVVRLESTSLSTATAMTVLNLGFTISI